MERPTCLDMNCGGLTFLIMINALWEQFTAKKGPRRGEEPPGNQEAAAALITKSPRREHMAAAKAAAPTQFRRFPDLPAEVRLLIWEEAARYKRYVVLVPPCNSVFACFKFWMDFAKYDDPKFAGRRRPLWTSPTPPPTMLSVSSEARHVALKVWRPAFACEVFPAAVYINFDQDDVVIKSNALVTHTSFGMGGPIDRIFRPWEEWVATMTISCWKHTEDVENIQRLVACGNFMRGIRDYAGAQDEFMTGLKSLIMIRIGNLQLPHARKFYVGTSRSGKGAPLLSLGGIDFANTAENSWLRPAITRSFAEIEVINFAGGTASTDVGTWWNLGPQTLGWNLIRSGGPRSVDLGPGKRCVEHSKWYCQTRKMTNIWYAV
ncbi:hypothetical protein KVR01_011302 [Diaporthe batatas]|uniref:uncharacterized protein n=1 Tax=Diaporthe batatas TaxID=748121 RepID=UPI001D0426A1|nr:uncharacterized protein KVR01_011302 [Diaporthe batatas]KAG8158859.1 hypothetical protein KVR01_011302 [Diaporthe batatas]